MACPICLNDIHPAFHGNLQLYNCPRCGEFSASDTFVAMQPHQNLSPVQIANASGWIRENQNVQLNNGHWEFLKSIKTPSVADKAEKLFLYLSKRFPIANQGITYDPNLEVISVCWASSPDEVNYLFHSYLVEYKQYIHKINVGGHPFKISPTGWDYLYSLKTGNKESKIGFCAMWFDDSVTSLWTDAIYPAIEHAGFEPKRIDQHEHNNKIDDEIIAMLRQSKFVVADYTGNRGGVYFEAGFALGLGLPVIWTCRNDFLEQIHFDTRQYNFITWDIDNLPEFSQRLLNRIEATIL
jgi:hypothetical protein